MTRGERNFNPGNIRISDQVFQGEINSTDPDFKQFESAQMGIRAIAVILKTYYSAHGLKSIYGIISRWAPGNENDTKSYIESVCDHTGYGADDEINVSDPDILENLTQAIIWEENGQMIYSMDDVGHAVALS